MKKTQTKPEIRSEITLAQETQLAYYPLELPDWKYKELLKETDHLKCMFDLQEEFQKRVKNSKYLYKKEPDVQFVMYMIISLIDELMEALRTTPWKNWKKGQTMNIDHLQEEVIDAWHFLINLSMAVGMDNAQVYKKFTEKSLVNRKRLEKCTQKKSM